VCEIDLFIAILQEGAPESSRRTGEGEEAGVSYVVFDCMALLIGGGKGYISTTTTDRGLMMTGPKPRFPGTAGEETELRLVDREVEYD
jgi:hypothetical protein